MNDLIRWDIAAKTAKRFAAQSDPTPNFDPDSLSADFAEFTPQAQNLVAAATSLEPSTRAKGKVVSREDWIDANIASFQKMLKPLMQKLSDKPRPITAAMGAMEVGLLLGWMSKRVLGQYDLLITDEESSKTGGSENSGSKAGSGGKADEQKEAKSPPKSREDSEESVYFVGVNIAALEWRHGFDKDQFRLWIAVHELTHYAQFSGVPWMRKHFLSLTEKMMDTVDTDMSKFLEGLKQIRSVKKTEAGQQDNAPEPGIKDGLPGLLANPQQKELMNKISGLMSLLEGHGEVIMDRASKDVVPEVKRFHTVMRTRRRSMKGLSAIFVRLMGIESKMRQYSSGEDFVKEIEKTGGDELFSKVWENPENLPSMNEINNPQLWVARMSKVEVAA